MSLIVEEDYMSEILNDDRNNCGVIGIQGLKNKTVHI